MNKSGHWNFFCVFKKPFQALIHPAVQNSHNGTRNLQQLAQSLREPKLSSIFFANSVEF